MIRNAVDWLEQHRVINVLIVIVYASFLLFAHNVFVDLSVVIMNALSLAVYEKVVASTIVLLVMGMIGAVYFIVRNQRFEWQSVLLFGGILLMLVAHFFVLTEMNIEFIHAIMYGLLAVLLFPLVGRFGGAVIAGLPIMLVDEWYQYTILFPHYVRHFELNDVVLDLLGAGFFVSVLGLFGLKSKRKFVPFFKRFEVWVCVAFVISVITLMATCVVVPYSVNACDNTWLILNKLPEQTAFWSIHPTIGSTLHVLKPVEGLLLVFILCVLFLGMDAKRLKSVSA